MQWKKFKTLAFNRLPDDKFQTLPNWKSLQTTMSNLTKMAEQVENTVEKGEIARYENVVGKDGAISPFPTVFSKGLFPSGVKRCHCVGIGLNGSIFSHNIFQIFQCWCWWTVRQSSGWKPDHNIFSSRLCYEEHDGVRLFHTMFLSYWNSCGSIDE